MRTTLHLAALHRREPPSSIAGASTGLPLTVRFRRAAATAGLVLLPLLTVLGCGSSQAPVSTSGIPRALVLAARPIGRGPRFSPPVRGPVIGRCRRRLGARVGVHVEVFAANRVVIVPAGIGTRGPWAFSAGRISGAGCYGDLVSLEPTGVVLVAPGHRVSVSDLFRAWGQPLSPRRLAGFAAPRGADVTAFVGGRRWRGLPANIPLARHSEIVLEVGPDVPPHRAYTFPPGT